VKVVILCGGVGTRLREQTEFRPKPLVEIGPRPILWHIMKSFATQGHMEFVLCLGYRGELIKQYFHDYEVLNNDSTIVLGDRSSIEIHRRHDEADWCVTLADTGATALKGARLKAIERYVDGDAFFVTYGDGVGDIDVNALLEFHRSHGRLATVTGVNAHARFGRLRVEGDSVTEFAEKPEHGDDLINGGFFVFDRRVLDMLEARDDCDLEYGLLEELAHRGELMVYRHPGFWACMDTQRDVEHLNGLWERNEAPWRTW
jgi:glucose-1-phosphate cytidylyltransferase